MDYSAWALQQLRHKRMGEKRQKVSVWFTSDSKKPVIVLVHGISGDHAGMVPLAVELADTYRVVIVELPGHGSSSPVPLPNPQALQAWFHTALGLLEAEFGDVALVCAHSFGCLAVLDEPLLRKKPVILINPVPTPSVLYERYSRLIMRSTYFWAHIYNWRLFILMRNLVLTKLHTREAKRRVRWVGWHSQPSYRQVVYQAGLVDMILSGAAYKQIESGRIRLVVCGLEDTTSRQRDSYDMEQVFGVTPVLFLNGGHLLPIESPDKVAAVIDEVMVH